jgi:hypothetical protein
MLSIEIQSRTFDIPVCKPLHAPSQRSTQHTCTETATAEEIGSKLITDYRISLNM